MALNIAEKICDIAGVHKFPSPRAKSSDPSNSTLHIVLKLSTYPLLETIRRLRAKNNLHQTDNRPSNKTWELLQQHLSNTLGWSLTATNM